jgi:bifunctional UDP-N-acetylglucosamine pyrophosphorylase/glucosamine-1-phosphate N-acetyltransferase
MLRIAVIPAAGLGKRLRPLTEKIPKALIPVAGKPVIRHNIDKLLNLEFKRIIIIIGYKADLMRQELANTQHVEFVEQPELLGTAHCLAKVNFLREPFLVINADIVVDLEDIKKLIQKFEANKPAVLIGCAKVENPEKFGVLEVDSDRVVKICEKTDTPTSNLVNAGIYIFDPIIFKFIKKIKKSPRGEYELTDAMQLMIDDDEDVRCMRLNRWMDIGTKEDFIRAEEFLGK